MGDKKYRAILISDFNINNLNGYLNNDNGSPIVEASVAPFGQLMQTLIQRDASYRQREYDLAVVWTRPEEAIKSFGRILRYESVSIDEILEEVDAYTSALLNLRDRTKFIFVPTWVFPSSYNGFGMLDMKNDFGAANVLMRMNLRLSENLGSIPSFYLLNAHRWIGSTGERAFDPRLWYLAKIPFANEVFKEAAKDIKSALCGIEGNARKLIILDLDETLWGGIVGDVGWENIKLGGHDHTGEAFVDFQRALKALRNRGVLLAIVSKNEESLALEAIKNNPEMVLRLEDFAGWRINWKDKAQNIIELISDLNLGLQSAIFIDDNSVERARVREALPEVLVPEWPEDNLLYKKALLGLRCFDAPFISKEDLERTNMYVTERKRRHLKSKFSSTDEWLKTLNIKVGVEEVNEANLQRVAQLLNKTSQMNLSTRRMAESELMEYARNGNNKFWTFRVSDKFGDSGLVGVATLNTDNKIGRIMDFVLSCRAIGRKIEEAMLYTVIKYASSAGLDSIYAKYIPTPKNKPCLEFWKQSGFTAGENELFSWDLKSMYPLPDCITIDEKVQYD